MWPHERCEWLRHLARGVLVSEYQDLLEEDLVGQLLDRIRRTAVGARALFEKVERKRQTALEVVMVIVQGVDLASDSSQGNRDAILFSLE